MRAAGVLGIVSGAVVAGLMACSGDTFTNVPGGGGDGGPGVDAGGDAGADARQSCAPGASERAFCSNFDKSTDVRDDKWSVSGAQQSLHVRNAGSFNATTAPNFLFVDTGDNDRAFVTTNLPATKRFKLTFDLRAQELGNQQYVPLRLSFCPRVGNCITFQLRFAAPNDARRQAYLEDANLQTVVGDVGIIDGAWARVVLESNLDAAQSGLGAVRVTFGNQDPRDAGIIMPSNTLAQLDHVELSLGAISAETGGNAYQLAFDTVIFEPAP